MKIAVLGDSMLDILRIGSSTRVSPECNTCLVVNANTEERSLGGAANVAYWLAQGTPHEVTLYCHHGNFDPEDYDESREARAFQIICEKSGIRLDSSLQRPYPYTITTKERIGVRSSNGGVNYIARIDNDMVISMMEYEAGNVIRAICNSKPDIIVVADYRKTVFIEKYGQSLIDAFCCFSSNNWFPPIIVNSKFPKAWTSSPIDFLIYNQNEGENSWPNITPWKMVGHTFAVTHIMTLGAKGVRVDRQDGGFMAPAHTDQAVDVTGAGDAFVAGLVAQLSILGKPKSDLTRADLEAIIRNGQWWAADCVSQIGCGKPQAGTQE